MSLQRSLYLVRSVMISFLLHLSHRSRALQDFTGFHLHLREGRRLSPWVPVLRVSATDTVLCVTLKHRFVRYHVSELVQWVDLNAELK